MKFSHKYIGTPIISKLGRLIYKVDVFDFNCGLRGYDTEKINNLNCTCGGMEYASEMIIKAKINNLSMCEVPTVLRKDLRDRKPHLKTIRDGFRHLFLISKMFIHKKKYKVLDDKK